MSHDRVYQEVDPELAILSLTVARPCEAEARPADIEQVPKQPLYLVADKSRTCWMRFYAAACQYDADVAGCPWSSFTRS